MSIPETLRVHLATDPSESGHYRLDRERFENAGRAFPDAFRRLRPTYSDDEAGFVRGVRDADVLIGWKFPRRVSRSAPRSSAGCSSSAPAWTTCTRSTGSRPA